MASRASGALALLLAACTAPADKDDTGPVAAGVDLPEDCAALPHQDGIRLGPEDAATLRETLATAPAGSVYLLDDGTYPLTGGDAAHNLDVASGVTVRSATGNAAAVVLEGGYATTELVTLRDGATLAEVTVAHASGNAVAIRGGSGARVYGVVVDDPGGAGVAVLSERGVYSDEATIGCVTVRRSERCEVGIQGVQSEGSRVYGATIDAPGCDADGIRFATGSRDTLIERTRIATTGAGIKLGDSDYEEGDERVYPDAACPDRTLVGHYGGIVRNVFVSGGALRAEDVCGGTIAHASVWGGDLSWGFAEDLVVANNLASLADGGGATVSGNLAPAPADFVSPDTGDLHLADGSAAIGAATALPDVTDDIDGDTRAAMTDVGADQR